jgi:hypothetical protein
LDQHDDVAAYLLERCHALVRNAPGDVLDRVVTVATKPNEGGGGTQMVEATRIRVVHDDLIVEENKGKPIAWPRTKCRDIKG